MLFLVEDNGYAISVPVEAQTPGGDISRLVSGFPGLLVPQCDGTDYIASYRALEEAIGAHPRPARVQPWSTPRSRGPTRTRTPTTSGWYKPPAEREAEARRDPLVRMRALLDRGRHRLRGRAGRDAGGRRARGQRGGRLGPRGAQARPGHRVALRLLARRRSGVVAFDAEPRTDGTPSTMVAAINQTLKDEMARDARIVVFGAGRGRRHPPRRARARRARGACSASRTACSGCYGERPRLQLAARRGQHRRARRRHGDARPEAGRRDPVLRLHLARLHADSRRAVDDALPVEQPLVVPGGDSRADRRLPARAARRTTARRAVAIFAHCPGIRVVLPSNAQDAAGLLRTAIRCDDPVLFCEHKHLYRQTYNKGPYPGPDYTMPFGKAAVVRDGTDVVVFTCGALVQRSLFAAQQAQDHDGISVAVIDLRTIAPLDWETIAAYTQRTSRVIVAHEDQLTCGLRSRDRGAHLGRAVRISRRAGEARGGARHTGGLRAGARGGHPARVRRMCSRQSGPSRST